MFEDALGLWVWGNWKFLLLLDLNWSILSSDSNHFLVQRICIRIRISHSLIFRICICDSNHFSFGSCPMLYSTHMSVIANVASSNEKSLFLKLFSWLFQGWAWFKSFWILKSTNFGFIFESVFNRKNSDLYSFSTNLDMWLEIQKNALNTVYTNPKYFSLLFTFPTADR